MATIAELLGSRIKEGDVGIEIECEGRDLKVPPANSYWTAVRDRSLRGNFPYSASEYVLAAPIKSSNVLNALKAFKKINTGAKFAFSPRTSVHVHLNMQRKEETKVLNFIYLYMLMESLLMKYSGEGREHNLFCMRIGEANGAVDMLEYAFKHGIRNTVLHYGEDTVRYLGINLASLRKYGSIEIRTMRGTDDINVLNKWVKILNKMLASAEKFSSCCEIFNLVSDKGADFLIKKVFGIYTTDLEYKGMQEDVNEAVMSHINIPACFKHRIEAKPVAVPGDIFME